MALHSICRVWLLSVCALAMPVSASSENGPAFSLPLDCVPNETCWIASYFDHDASGQWSDYGCGPISYDTHAGTDFAIRDLDVMRRGVAVLAAAPGVVVSVREGMRDVNVRRIGAAALGGKDCGNRVGIDHGNGWATQYCHLKQGSVVVRQGDRVTAGQPVGAVGLSGRTEYPHLHFEVYWNQRRIDPFVGPTGPASCGARTGSVWAADTLDSLPYRAGMIYNIGMSTDEPSVESVKAGTARRRSGPVDSARIVVWAQVFATPRGHAVAVDLFAPDGQRVRQLEGPTRGVQGLVNNPLRAIFARRDGGWTRGTYRGVLTVRDPQGRTVDQAEASLELR